MFRNDIAAAQFANAIRLSDFIALSAAQQSWLQLVVAQRVIDATQANLRADILAVFPAGGAGTRANLTALAQRSGSRAEQLFGTGTLLTANDVARALTEF